MPNNVLIKKTLWDVLLSHNFKPMSFLIFMFKDNEIFKLKSCTVILVQVGSFDSTEEVENINVLNVKASEIPPVILRKIKSRFNL